jgi:hypothetical protein
MNATLPTISPLVTLSLDETGEFPRVIVSAPRDALTRAVVAHCHAVAGEAGAGIEFRPT